MFELIAQVEPDGALRWIELTVESPTLEDLAVDTLSALLWHSEVADILFCAFVVTEAPGGLAVNVRAGGVPMSEVESIGPPIKAVTYHRLAVEQREEGWYGRVYFDV